MDDFDAINPKAGKTQPLKFRLNPKWVVGLREKRGSHMVSPVLQDESVRNCKKVASIYPA